MIKLPKITKEIEKKHGGETLIALDGEILGIGKTSIEAVKEAKKKDPDIEDKEFLIWHIDTGRIRA